MTEPRSMTIKVGYEQFVPPRVPPGMWFDPDTWLILPQGVRSAAKVRVAATAENAGKVVHHQVDLNSAPDVFGPILADELKAHAFYFDLQVQLCTDLKAMPVNDATREWPEKLSPFVTVGRVRIPRQDITGSLKSDAADALAFNQWRVTAEHRPLGEIMNVRRIYSAAAKVRRTLNHQPQTEPASIDDVLGPVTQPTPAAGPRVAI